VRLTFNEVGVPDCHLVAVEDVNVLDVDAVHVQMMLILLSAGIPLAVCSHPSLLEALHILYCRR
jgi:hypothetical protein